MARELVSHTNLSGTGPGQMSNLSKKWQEPVKGELPAGGQTPKSTEDRLLQAKHTLQNSHKPKTHRETC